MRKALIVGIDHYRHVPPLFGCVNDAHAVKSALERHSDGTRNFDVMMMTGTGPADLIERGALKDAVAELFSGDPEIALFYFAGHGHIEATGGYLCAGEAKRGDDGLSISEIMKLAHDSKARNKLVLLDSCHSGIAGVDTSGQFAELSEGMTILTASTAEQYATEADGAGIFTTLLVDALNGAAANLIGEVTPGSIYAHIDQSLGAWEQRPIFRTNVKSFVSLRSVQPQVELADLRRLTELFPEAGSGFALDPTFEPERSVPPDPEIPAPIEENTRKFAILQKLNRVGLVVPVDAPHMYHAAMESKSCKLTVLGEHYRRLVERGRI
jgi:hypothetical protein